jgi:hypothetical protein
MRVKDLTPAGLVALCVLAALACAGLACLLSEVLP